MQAAIPISEPNGQPPFAQMLAGLEKIEAAIAGHHRTEVLLTSALLEGFGSTPPGSPEVATLLFRLRIEVAVFEEARDRVRALASAALAERAVIPSTALVQ